MARLKTMFWAKQMRSISDAYRENIDKVKWADPRDRFEIEEKQQGAVTRKVYRFKS